MLVEVAVRSPLRRLLTYEADQDLPKGTRVRVPFRSREIWGVVWGAAEQAPKGLKKISRVLDQEPFYDAQTLEFYEKAAQYYGISLGDLLGLSLPKKILEGVSPKPVEKRDFKFNLAELSEDQRLIVEEVQKTRGFCSHLLWGETGSGKTEIYLHLFREHLREGRQCLFLVPEISLTPQLEDRLAERLGVRVSLFHSQLSERKREEAFIRAHRGDPEVFLGARSALFLPFKNLGAIVVDEEHDGSYKQSERGLYHARDLALWRAQILGIPVILGSATPSLETYVRAKTGKSHSKIHRLQKFHQGAQIEQKLVDLKASWKKEGRSFISESLREAIERTLQKGEQSLLFLNRRGSASQRICVSCGHLEECTNCSVTLTVHRDLGMLVCHWCGFQRPLSKGCSACHQTKDFFEGGVGTKTVEEELRRRFPDARIKRLDRDETQSRNSLPEIIRSFADGSVDILIGTQMISKGIDIPKLSLIGVILADLGWGVPDFRANERAFQLLQQVKGRAGRRGQASELIIQTFSTDNPIFEWLSDEDRSYERMSEAELEVRRLGGFPPYKRLALWTLSHRSDDILQKMAQRLALRMKQLGSSVGMEVLGPTPAPVFRWKGVYRYHILNRSEPQAPMTAYLTAALDDLEKIDLSGVKLKLDRDPQHFL